MRELLLVDEVRDAREHRRAEERVRDAGNGRERDDRERAADERQRDEDAEPDEVGGDDQPLAREPVDERPGGEADDHRRQERDDEERAHPPRRMRAVVDVGGERDRRHPGADARAERREEEQAEAGAGRSILELAAEAARTTQGRAA